MINAVITTSGYLFWIVILAVIALDTMFLADDMQVQATFLTTGLFVGIILFTDAFIGTKIATLIVATLIYLLIGTGWSVFKWIMFVRNKLQNYKDVWNRTTPATQSFVDYIKDKQPTASSHKSEITGWITLWPFSLSWWVMTWPRRAAIWLYERLSTLFDRISARIWEAN